MPAATKKVPLNIDPPAEFFAEPVNPTISPLEDIEFEQEGPSTAPESFYSDPGSRSSDPGGELIEGFFPKPIAPSHSDSLPPTPAVFVQPSVAEDAAPSSPVEPPSVEPQRMVATATHAAPPVELVAPQQHATSTDVTAQYSSPSAFFQPSAPLPSVPVAEPVMPTSPYTSQVGPEPAMGGISPSAAVPTPGVASWFDQPENPEPSLATAGNLDAILPGAFDIEDLPTCTETREQHIPKAKQLLQRAIRVAQDDLYVATILAATTCMSGILLLTLLMKSCG